MDSPRKWRRVVSRSSSIPYIQIENIDACDARTTTELRMCNSSNSRHRRPSRAVHGYVNEPGFWKGSRVHGNKQMSPGSRKAADCMAISCTDASDSETWLFP
eukprot:5368634-Pleurochrysis_carterae.AAC.1